MGHFGRHPARDFPDLPGAGWRKVRTTYRCACVVFCLPGVAINEFDAARVSDVRHGALFVFRVQFHWSEAHVGGVGYVWGSSRESLSAASSDRKSTRLNSS